MCHKSKLTENCRKNDASEKKVTENVNEKKKSKLLVWLVTVTVLSPKVNKPVKYGLIIFFFSGKHRRKVNPQKRHSAIKYIGQLPTLNYVCVLEILTSSSVSSSSDSVFLILMLRESKLSW